MAENTVDAFEARLVGLSRHLRGVTCARIPSNRQRLGARRPSPLSMNDNRISPSRVPNV